MTEKKQDNTQDKMIEATAIKKKANKPKTTKKPSITTSTKPRAKKLDIKKIESIYDDINKMSTFLYDEEKNIQIKYYPIFGDERINDLFEDVHEAMKYVDEHKLDFFADDAEFTKYVFLMIIKHMTELKDDIPNDIATQFSVLNQIIAIGLFDKLFNEAFDGNEVAKVLDKLTEFVTLNEKLEKAVQQEFSRLSYVENKEVLKPYNVMNKASSDVLQ